jgi:hypothetical protein
MAIMTLGELKSAVMGTIGAEFTADIVRYLNKGLLELSSESQVLARDNVAIVNGAFAVPAACLIPKDVFYEGYPLAKYNKPDVPATFVGAPIYWLRDGANIKVYPQPDTNTTAQIIYVKRESIIEAEADTHTLADADEFLIAYAKWKVLVDTKGLSDEAMYWKQEAANEKEKWRELNLAQYQRPRKVRVGRWS